MRVSLFASVQTIQPMLDWTHEYRLPDAHLQTYPDTKPGIKYFHRIFFGFVIICYVLIKFQSRSIWLNILVYLLNVIECYVSLYTREIVIRDDNSVFVIVSDNPCTSRMPTTMSKKSTQNKRMYESIKHVLLHCIFDISSVTHKFRLISYEKNTCQFDNIVFSTYAD